MPKKQISSDKIAKPNGHFSPATVIEARGRLVFISGMTARRPDGSIAGIGDIEAQTRQVCENLKAVLVSRAGQMNDIVKLTIYVLSKSDYKTRAREIGAVYRDYFGRHYPAMTLVEVKGLYDDGCLIEIEAVAVVD